MKVLVSDSLAAQGVEVLQQAEGLEVIERPGASPDELLELIRDVDGLVIRSGTKVTADVIAAAENLRVIGRAGIGVDNVDVPAATNRGIVVVNTPEGNNITTAEHAIALMVSAARHVPHATASMKAGKWEKKKFQGMELFNRTLGVVGAGVPHATAVEHGAHLPQGSMKTCTVLQLSCCRMAALPGQAAGCRPATGAAHHHYCLMIAPR